MDQRNDLTAIEAATLSDGEEDLTELIVQSPVGVVVSLLTGVSGLVRRPPSRLKVKREQKMNAYWKQVSPRRA